MENKPYDDKATPKQQHIILRFFEGLTVDALAKEYKEQNSTRGGKAILLKDAKHIVELALMHIKWS